jgi:hypothetical protein
MEQSVSVHRRISESHPDISEVDVLTAWRGRVACQMRTGPWPPQYVAVGFDGKGRTLQMVATYDPMADETLIFHAMSVTDKVRKELNLG